MSRPWRIVPLLLVSVGVGTIVYVNQRGIIHLLGIDTQQSDNYDFVSGVGPMIITAVGYTGIIVGLWHHVNCHYTGCLRIARHRIDGTPWCNRHQLNARAAVKADLEDVVELLKAQNNVLNQLVSRSAPPSSSSNLHDYASRKS